MIFGGVDLAAEARRTGIAEVSDDGELAVKNVHVGADDEQLADLVLASVKTGLDVPLGWPDSFVRHVVEHAAGEMLPPISTDLTWRRAMAMRTTDLVVRDRTGIVPLSVSADKIAYPALRWAGVEARLRVQGTDVARDGSGRICEVYPAATLKCWLLPSRGYKGKQNKALRVDLITQLTRVFPSLNWNGHQEICASDDNAFDAVLAALMAYLVHQDLAVPPPPEASDVVLREGWIWLPETDPFLG
ncbi:DUF429 domain-containing protein [Brevibacterium sp. UCMA 11752]|uniref:DUF429 domain-containing protein n=1 Tax=Brevibacterium sp. UCMA 11752 TaxID=2745946 RepID=UPI001F44EF26|nr:DUF429 domain-containing protein [Brevibacterium sp. UCMA 11752]MCF2588666.1 DUF429 domain-containing protein [Brevibacterium sp. UCMA 11752]